MALASPQGCSDCADRWVWALRLLVSPPLRNQASTDFSVSLLLFWAFGFALMFGASHAGWIGTSGFFLSVDGKNSVLVTTFLFQAMFCATAATIVSGAVAGRMRFFAYIVTTLIVSGLVYPIFGHWAWGGAGGGTQGWLAARGFVDFAGCTVSADGRHWPRFS